jgi:hypothetical protein
MLTISFERRAGLRIAEHAARARFLSRCDDQWENATTRCCSLVRPLAQQSASNFPLPYTSACSNDGKLFGGLKRREAPTLNMTKFTIAATNWHGTFSAHSSGAQ